MSLVPYRILRMDKSGDGRGGGCSEGLGYEEEEQKC
jgi:hypothetical protein